MSVNPIAVGAVELLLAAAFVGYELKKIIEGGLKPKMQLPREGRGAPEAGRAAAEESPEGARRMPVWMAAIGILICAGVAIVAFRSAAAGQGDGRFFGYAAIGLAAWIAYRWWRAARR